MWPQRGHEQPTRTYRRSRWRGCRAAGRRSAPSAGCR